ncbi:predicted protein [Streptomyces sp. C]|nr:predicted protein [Streptomyces sp. C]
MTTAPGELRRRPHLDPGQTRLADRGAEAAIEAFNTTTTLGLARIEDGAWRFIAVLPEGDGRPLVARGPRTLSGEPAPQ